MDHDSVFFVTSVSFAILPAITLMKTQKRAVAAGARGNTARSSLTSVHRATAQRLSNEPAGTTGCAPVSKPLSLGGSAE
jgi:hypothetical protein